MSGPARAPTDRLPTAYAVWCVLRSGGAWSAKSIAAQVDGPLSTVRYILPALVEAGYAARGWRGGSPRAGGCWEYRVARDPAPRVPRVVLSNGRTRVALVEDRAARQFSIHQHRRPPIRPWRERHATDHICAAVLRYGLRDAARRLGVAPERLAQRTRARAPIDADECRALLASITIEGQIMGPLGKDLAELAEPVELDGEPRDEPQEAHA